MTALDGIVKVAPDAYCVPLPLAAVFHDENVYPVRVGTVDDTVAVVLIFTDACTGAPVPPLASYDNDCDTVTDAENVTVFEPLRPDIVASTL